jgi:hypothetical protein
VHNKATNKYSFKYNSSKVTLKPMIVAEILEAGRIRAEREERMNLNFFRKE